MSRLQILIDGKERLGADIENDAPLHEVLAELAKSLKAMFDGKSKPMRMNDSHNTKRPVICAACGLEIPKYESYTYTTDEDGEDVPYHTEQCHPTA